MFIRKCWVTADSWPRSYSGHKFDLNKIGFLRHIKHCLYNGAAFDSGWPPNTMCVMYMHKLWEHKLHFWIYVDKVTVLCFSFCKHGFPDSEKKGERRRALSVLTDFASLSKKHPATILVFCKCSILNSKFWYFGK